MSTDIWPWIGGVRGHKGMLQLAAGQVQALEYEKFEPREFIAQDNRVVALLFERFRMKQTGRVVDNEYVMVFSVRDGKITHLRVYEDTAPIIAAIRNQDAI